MKYLISYLLFLSSLLMSTNVFADNGREHPGLRIKDLNALDQIRDTLTVKPGNTRRLADRTNPFVPDRNTRRLFF